MSFLAAHVGWTFMSTIKFVYANIFPVDINVHPTGHASHKHPLYREFFNELF